MISLIKQEGRTVSTVKALLIPSSPTPFLSSSSCAFVFECELGVRGWGWMRFYTDGSTRDFS